MTPTFEMPNPRHFCLDALFVKLASALGRNATCLTHPTATKSVGRERCHALTAICNSTAAGYKLECTAMGFEWFCSGDTTRKAAISATSTMVDAPGKDHRRCY